MSHSSHNGVMQLTHQCRKCTYGLHNSSHEEQRKGNLFNLWKSWVRTMSQWLHHHIIRNVECKTWSYPEIDTNWFSAFAKTCWVNIVLCSKQAAQASITYSMLKWIITLSVYGTKSPNGLQCKKWKLTDLSQWYPFFLRIYYMNRN